MVARKQKDTPKYTPYGAARSLFFSARVGTIQEILIEGGFATGKTRAVLEWAMHCADNYPGCRILLIRKTQHSMRESVMVTLEEKVLWAGHPALQGGASRARRESYDWPNRSHIVVGGLDNADKYMSSEWDMICVFEAHETTEHDWEKLKGRIGRAQADWMIPFQQIIADTNPARRDHWLNKRFPKPGYREIGEEGAFNEQGRVRLLSRHEDNPGIPDAYYKSLSEMTGARRSRYFLHEWVSEEGLVYPEFDPAVHVIEKNQLPEMAFYVGGVDWGTTAPGTFQVWGVDNEKRVYLVKELYRTDKDLEWWADKAEWLQSIYDMRAIWCDPQGREKIIMFNKRLAKLGAAGIARPANNDVDAGIVKVKEMLKSDGIKPRLFVVRDSLIGIDESLKERGRPTCFVEEIEALTWSEFEFGKTSQMRRDRPDPTCDDHSMDPTRYVMMGLEAGGFTGREKRRRYTPGTWGHLFKHWEVGKPKAGLTRDKWL